jgi:hypothetical protein
MPFDPRHEQTLDALAATLIASEKTLETSASKELVAILGKLRTFGSDIFTVAIIYIAGFDAIKSGTVPAIPVVQEWIRRVGVRSPWTIAAMTSTALCASLEGFLREFGTAAVDSARVARVRSLARGRALPVDEEAAKGQIRGWLVPTAKTGGKQWLARIEEVFDLRLDPAVQECLVSLIDARNKFAHDPRPELGGVYQISTGEEVKCWGMAVFVLGHALVSVTTRS